MDKKKVIIDGDTREITENQWLEIVEPIIQTRARKYCKYHIKNHLEDILQELRLKAVSLFREYDINKGTDIKIFAFIILRHKCLNINKKYNNYEKKHISINDKMFDEMEDTDTTHLMNSIYETFNTDYERDLISLIVNNANVKKYARENNIHYSKIRRDIEKIKEEIKNYVEER